MKNKTSSTAILILLVLLCLSIAQQAFAQTSARKFYKYEVLAATSTSLDVYAAPSINDYGAVAFSGRKVAGGGTVFLSEIGQPAVDLMPSLSTTSTQFVGGRVQINNLNQVIQHTFVSGTTPAQNYLRRINGVDNFTLIAAANGAGSFNDFDQIYPGSISINNAGQSVFLTRRGSNTTILTTGERPAFSALQFPSTGDSLRPMISDIGCVVVRAGANATDPLRLYTYDLTAFETIASAADGFTAIGQSPALSGGCEVIVFYGDLNATGAQTLGTNAGPGIFASIDIGDKQRKIVRLAGRLIEDNAAPGGNDDGYCDTGETCMQGELGFNQSGNPIFFSSFDNGNRVAVAHQSVGADGIEDDIFVVSFLGTPNIGNDRPERPFSNQYGLWTLTTQIKNENGVMREKPSVAVPVVQIGDVINSRTVTAINVYDQIANVRTPLAPSQEASVPVPGSESPGDHRLAFHVATNNGNMIIRARRNVGTPVIFIPGVGGSVLVEQESSNLTERWLGGLNSSNYERLSLAPNQERNIVATDVLRDVRLAGFPVQNIYGNLLEKFSTIAGLTEYKIENKPERRTFAGCDMTQATAQPNLFVFAYDWRKSNSENAVKLKDYVRCVQRFYPGTEVDIVAHSMGGLLGRRYILDNSPAHSVRKMITIGSPFLGAPRKIEVLEKGNFFNFGLNAFTAFNRTLTSANAVFRNLLPHLKGPQELLPSKAYFDLGGLPFSENFDFNNDGNLTTYDYPTLRSAFNSRYSTQPYEVNHIFHQGEQDDWRQDSSGVEYYHLFGRQIDEKTIKQVIAKRVIRGPRIISNSKIRFEILKGPGDGTVPVLSAERIGNSLNLNAPGVIPEAFFPESGEDDDDVEHNGLTKNPRVQERIFNILELASQSIVGSKSHQGEESNMQPESTNPPAREANYLSIDGVERLQIADDLGNTNTAVNDQFELAIPNVSYTPSDYDGLFTHDLTMPISRQYTIKFRTGTDIVDIKLVRGINNGSPSYTVRYIDLELPANVDCLLTINAQGMEDLRYDSDGDGTYDTVVPAHVRLSGADAQDVTAPSVSVTYSRRTSGGRIITVTADDSQSGVKTIYYRVDETGNYQLYTGPFFVSVISPRVVEVFADDNAGNRSSPVRIVVPSF
jgi:pimeloyl-ACP methyl ester carboxylesterase